MGITVYSLLWVMGSVVSAIIWNMLGYATRDARSHLAFGLIGFQFHGAFY